MTRPIFTTFVVCAVAVGLYACGGKAVIDGDAGAGAGSGTGGTATAVTNVSVVSSTSTGVPATCPELFEIHQELLQEARYCNPEISSLQCEVEYKESPFLCCPVFLNKLATDTLDQLSEVDKLGADQMCAVGCPEIPCAPLLEGYCQPMDNGPNLPGGVCASADF